MRDTTYWGHGFELICSPMNRRDGDTRKMRKIMGNLNNRWGFFEASKVIYSMGFIPRRKNVRASGTAALRDLLTQLPRPRARLASIAYPEKCSIA